MSAKAFPRPYDAPGNLIKFFICRRKAKKKRRKQPGEDKSRNKKVVVLQLLPEAKPTGLVAVLSVRVCRLAAGAIGWAADVTFG